ncbi:hypothetical protein [Gordonia sihwensis]|uniref:hypothetical protein n=1 Tax=Gordonia sihwensis TaxID=173559 RepID=UPI0005F05885|nr:hypothetical protein [Gordonia sihwensis]KJR10573.1 hypothetical protein UG54_00875 [Gordonia sihwensis]
MKTAPAHVFNVTETEPDYSAPQWVIPAEVGPIRPALAAAFAAIPPALVEVSDVEDARANNSVRAVRAARALLTYCDIFSDVAIYEVEDMMTGLLTDLRHLCDALAIDVDRVNSDDLYEHERLSGD